MTDRLLLENQIAIMSALVEIAHAVGYGTHVSAETIVTLRQRVQKSERERDVMAKGAPKGRFDAYASN